MIYVNFFIPYAMKESMSNIDIKAIMFELEFLSGGKIEKIYHYPPDEIRIRIYAGTKVDLVIEAGKRIHLTKYPRISPRFPSSFAMLLRKYIQNGRIENIKQYDFDRIVDIEISRKDAKFHLICELFTKGNLILTDESGMIIMPLKTLTSTTRRVKQREVYTYPPSQPDPFSMGLDELRDLLNSEKSIVKILATRTNLGGIYAEEICFRAGVEKTRKGIELDENDIESILRAINEVFTPIKSGEFDPVIILDNGTMIDALPFPLEIYRDKEKKKFQDFNEALDEYFSRHILESLEKHRETDVDSRVLRLERRLESQKEAMKKFEREESLYQKKGDAIYIHYTLLERIHNALNAALKQKSWEEIARIIKEEKSTGNEILSLIKDIDPKQSSVTVVIDGMEFILNLKKTLHQIADQYYKLSKRARKKKEGVIQAIKNTEKEIEKAKERIVEEVSVPTIKIRRKVSWYEKYRWFKSSEGFIVIGGRNASMNEEIVTKRMEKHDLFFHTQYPGGPVVVVKTEGKEVGDKTIFEAAQFAVSYSSLWKGGVYEGECYYVSPQQVSKSPKSGEYLPKGSFYITGKRNYLSVPVGVAVGVNLEEQRVIGGPPSAIEKHADYLVKLTIGSTGHNELSRAISRYLYSIAKDEDKIAVNSICKFDSIAKFLPPGKSDMVVK